MDRRNFLKSLFVLPVLGASLGVKALMPRRERIEEFKQGDCLTSARLNEIVVAVNEVRDNA